MIYITEPGHYYGACYELCGINHAYMPIEVIAFDDHSTEIQTVKKNENEIQTVKKNENKNLNIISNDLINENKKPKEYTEEEVRNYLLTQQRMRATAKMMQAKNDEAYRAAAREYNQLTPSDEALIKARKLPSKDPLNLEGLWTMFRDWSMKHYDNDLYYMLKKRYNIHPQFYRRYKDLPQDQNFYDQLFKLNKQEGILYLKKHLAEPSFTYIIHINHTDNPPFPPIKSKKK